MSDPASIPQTPDAIFGKEAVAAALAHHAAVAGLADYITDAKWDRGELTLTVAPENIVVATLAARTAGQDKNRGHSPTLAGGGPKVNRCF